MWTVVALVAGPLMSAMGCSSGGPGRADPSGSSEIAAAPPGPADDGSWRACGTDLECSNLTIPGSSDPILFARRPAVGNADGTILVDPGGPGASGVALLRAGFNLGDAVAQQFDLVAWDPPSASGSVAACQTVLDTFSRTASPFDLAYLQRRGAELESEMAGAGCQLDEATVSRFGSRAMDDALVRFLDREGIGTVGYYGASYGSVHGIEFAARHPDRVRFVAFDGVVDPSVNLVDRAKAYSSGVVSQLAKLDERCAAITYSWCPHGQTVSKVAEDLALTAADGDNELGAEIATVLLFMLYGDDSLAAGGEALVRLADGDATKTDEIVEQYNSLGSLLAYLEGWCGDAARVDEEDIVADTTQPLVARAPLLELALCTLPVGPDEGTPELLESTERITAPTMLISNEGDLVTPPSWTDRAQGRFTTVERVDFAGSSHTSYSVSACVRAHVTDFITSVADDRLAQALESVRCAS